MIHFTYIQDSDNRRDGGRSGHRLQDIMTTFCMTHLFKEYDPKVVFDKSWLRQSIIDYDGFSKYTVDVSENYDFILDLNISTFPLVDEPDGSPGHHWSGLYWEDFLNLKTRIVKLNPKKNNILIKLGYGIKIFFYRLKLWESQGLISKDVYNGVISDFRDLFYEDRDRSQLNQIAIHIRTGDEFKRVLHKSLNYEYYYSLIKWLSSKTNFNIEVFCENINYESFLGLGKIKNTRLNVGQVSDIKSDIYKISRSSIVFLSPSTFSFFSGYLCDGLVVYDNLISQSRDKNNELLQFNSGFEKCFSKYTARDDLLKLIKSFKPDCLT